MNTRERPGIPVQEFTSGNVSATVWVNKPLNGELFVKVSFRRRQELSDGRVAYRSSFYPEDLGDLDEVILCTAAWFQETGHVLLHGRNDKPDHSKKSGAT